MRIHNGHGKMIGMGSEIYEHINMKDVKHMTKVRVELIQILLVVLSCGKFRHIDIDIDILTLTFSH